MNAQEYINLCNQANTGMEARNVAGKIYSCNSDASSSAYTSSIPITWDVFYAIYDMECRNSIEHDASSYAAVILSKPKIQTNWNKKENIRKYTSLDDYLQDVYLHISTKVIVNWDREKNDNFWAYLNRELLTVVAKTVDSDLSAYMQATNGMSLQSYDQMIEASRENGTNFDIEDTHAQSIEDAVLSKVETEKRADYQALLTHDSKTLYDKENIRNGLIASQLFGGLDKMPSSFASRVLDRMGRNESEAAEVR